MIMKIFPVLTILSMSLILPAEAQPHSQKKQRPHSNIRSEVSLSERERNELYKFAIERMLENVEIDARKKVILLTENINPQYFTTLGMPLMSEAEKGDRLKEGTVMYMYIIPHNMTRSKANFTVIQVREECGPRGTRCNILRQASDFHYRRVKGQMKLQKIVPYVLS
jgi:hypothetical protein